MVAAVARGCIIMMDDVSGDMDRSESGGPHDRALCGKSNCGLPMDSHDATRMRTKIVPHGHLESVLHACD